MIDKSQRKKLVVMVILLVVMVLVGFVRFGDKIVAYASSVAADRSSDSLAVDENVPMTFDEWRSPTPEIEWQKPETVKLSARDPMTVDLSTVKIESAKPQVRTENTVTDANTSAPISVEGAAFRVEGIVYRKEGKSSVIIAGQVLHEGDSVLGAVIIRISEHSVEFEKDGKRRIVPVGERSEGSQ